MANKKLLAATLAESLASKQPFLSLLSNGASNPADRPSPPSSRPVPPPVSRSHALPPPEGPDRSLIDPTPSPVKTEPVAGKKKVRRKFSDEEKSAIASRVLDGEKRTDVMAATGVVGSVMSRWLDKERKRRANAARGAARSATMQARKLAKQSGKAPPAEPTLASAPARPEPIAATGPLHSFEDWLRVVVRAEVRAALREALAGGLGK